MKRSISLLGGAVLAALPLAGLLTGCGNGNGGIITPTSTPSPTATSTAPTPTATTVVVPLGAAPVAFGNGQSGTLNLTRNGNTVSGTLVVNGTTNQQFKHSTRAFTFSIAAGIYQVTGTYTPPRGFTLTGTFPAPVGSFSISGTIPTTSETGSYTITAGGQTVTGTYPKIGTTPTPVPTTVQTPSPSSGSFSGTITGTSDANFGMAAFNPQRFNGTKTTQGSITVIVVSANETTPVDNNSRALAVTISAQSGGFTKGQVLPATALSSPTFPSAHINPAIAKAQTAQSPGSWGNFTVKSGSVTISDLTSTSITLVLNNVQVVGDYGSAKGTLTVNGTLKSSYTTS